MNALKVRMNRTAVFLLAVIALLVAHETRAGRQAAPLAPAVLATVNLEKIYAELALHEEANTRLSSLAAELDAEGERKRKEIDQIREDLDLLEPGTPVYESTQDDLVRKTHALRAYLEFATRKLDLARSQTLSDTYDAIKAEIEAMAGENGYDIVFVDDSVVALPSAATEAEMMRQISARRTLYADPRIDITTDLVERMNR